ncbi:hypothetical protein GCM10027572_16660 [Flexivirga lutea]
MIARVAVAVLRVVGPVTLDAPLGVVFGALLVALVHSRAFRGSAAADVIRTTSGRAWFRPATRAGALWAARPVSGRGAAAARCRSR